MNRITTRTTLAGAVLAVAVAVAFGMPAGAEAASGREGLTPAAVERQHDTTAAHHGGLNRTDAAVALAILAGVIAMALRGDVVIGSTLVLAAAGIGAAKRLFTGAPKSGPGWSDWPGGEIARSERSIEHRPRSRRPQRLVASLAQDKRAGNHDAH